MKHPRTTHFHLRQAALLTALAAAYPLSAWANAGVMQFSTGDVTVRKASSTAPQNLPRGARIDSGDTIVTGDSGRAQVRFTDGGLISLQPNSQFRIERYSDSANGGQGDSFLVDLARGGLRALTGLIGKRSRDNYKLTTSTATIGIRGSGFSVAYNPDGTIVVTTELDAIEVCTQAGCVGLNLGESALVSAADVLPRRTNVRAFWNAPPPRRHPGVRNDDVDANGQPLYVVRRASEPRTSALTLVGSGLDAEGQVDERNYPQGSLSVSSGGQIIGYSAQDSVTGGSFTEVSRTGSLEGEDLLVLGTWQNAQWSNLPGALPVSTVVIGHATPVANIASLQGQRAQYNFASGTPVYASTGDIGTLLPSSNLTVDFMSATRHVDVNLDVNLPVSNARSPRAGEPPSSYSIDYNLRGTATGTGSGFSGNLSISSADCNYGYTGCGVGQVNGFFSGSAAQNAGLTFSGSSDTHGRFVGAGTFSQSSPFVPTPLTTLFTGEGGYTTFVADGSGVFGDQSIVYPSGPLVVSPVAVSPVAASVPLPPGLNPMVTGPFSSSALNFSGVALTSCAICAEGSDLSQTAGPIQAGSIGQPGQSEFIGWGQWQQGSLVNSDGSTALSALHYITGQATSSMPYFLGQATYSLVGGTRPTATNGSVTQSGDILPSSNLQVDFGAYNVTANLDLRFGQTAVNFSANASMNGSTFSTNGNNPSTMINGMFVGNWAERAGLVYGHSHLSLGQIRGAAVFQRTTVPSAIPE